MKKHLAAFSCGILLAGSLACGDADDAPDDEVSGIQMASSVAADSDVDEMKYNVYKIDPKADGTCPSTAEVTPADFEEADPVIKDKQKELKENLRLPAGIPAFEDSPFHEDSQHEFADLFAHVDPGCYYVHVQPMTRIDDERKEKSDKCLPTWGTVDVEPNEVTEKVLISQCKQQHEGAILDIVAALNKPPKVTDAEVDDNKFNECPLEKDDKGKYKNPTEIYCVTATEPEKDPMNINWVLADDEGNLIFDQVFFSTVFGDEVGTFHPIPGSGIVGAQLDSVEDFLADADGNPVDDDTDPVQRIRTECLEIEFERLAASTQHNFGVVVYDKLYDNADLITFEDYFEALGIFDTETGLPILSRDFQALLKYVAACEDGGELRVCNQTMGYWKHLPNDDVVEARWAETEDPTYIPFSDDAERLCEASDAVGGKWIDIIRTPASFKNQYYNMARQYITAELNWARLDWDDPLARALLTGIGVVLNDPGFCAGPNPPTEAQINTALKDYFDFYEEDDLFGVLKEGLEEFNDQTCPDNGLGSLGVAADEIDATED